MMGDLKIAFDFINSKEYVSKFTADEFTDIDKLPENLKDKKFYIFNIIADLVISRCRWCWWFLS